MLTVLPAAATGVALAMGLHTLGSYAKSSGLYLVAAIASSIAGAALYRE